MKTKRFPRLHDDDTTQGKKKRHLFIGIGGTRTHARPNRYPGLKANALPTELRLRHTCFSNEFYLTIPLMIRMTTKLIPLGFLAYNQLLNALTGLMVIAYIIMIRKLI